MVKIEKKKKQEKFEILIYFNGKLKDLLFSAF